MAIKIAGVDNIDNDRNITSSIFQNYTETINALGSITAGTTNINLENGNIVTGTLPTSGTVTFTFTTSVTTGAVSFSLYLTNPGSTTSAALVWPASVKWQGNTTPSTWTTTASKTNIWSFITTNNGTSWFGNLSQNNL